MWFGIRDGYKHNYLKTLKIKFSRKEDILSNIPTLSLLYTIHKKHTHTHTPYLPPSPSSQGLDIESEATRKRIFNFFFPTHFLIQIMQEKALYSSTPPPSHLPLLKAVGFTISYDNSRWRMGQRTKISHQSGFILKKKFRKIKMLIKSRLRHARFLYI